MGLLDAITGYGDPVKSQAVDQLIGGLLNRNMGGGLLGANQVFSAAPGNAMRAQLLQAQIDEQRAQADERKSKVSALAAEQERVARVRAALPQLFTPQQITGGEAVPQTFGGSNVPMFSKPASATPVQFKPAGFNPQVGLAAGMNMEELRAAQEMYERGIPQVARTVEGMQGGRPATLQFDKFGNQIGQGVEQWKAPVFQNLGNRTVALDPVGLKERGSFAQGQSPESVASNAIAIRGQNMTDARARESSGAGKAPAGYRWSADGSALEAIPGGPAGKTATASEGERKAATLLQRLEGSSAQLNAVLKTNPDAAKPEVMASALRKVPFVGGDTPANVITSQPRQQVESAQLDMLDAALTLGTGAAYTKEQLEGYRKSYFPQIGDGPKAVADKQARLENVIKAARIAAGRAGGAAQGGASGGWGIKEIK